MSNPFRMVSKLTRRLVTGEAPRAEKSAENERSSTSAQLVFETFEPRLLLAADPLGIAAVALDSTAPTVSLTPPASIVSGTVNLSATASDNVGVVGVKFLLDANTTIGSEDTTSPYGVSWNTTTVANGTHTLRRRHAMPPTMLQRRQRVRLRSTIRHRPARSSSTGELRRPTAAPPRSRSARPTR